MPNPHQSAQAKSFKLAFGNGQNPQLENRTSFEESPQSDKGLLAESNDAGNRLKLSASNSSNDREPQLSPILELDLRARNVWPIKDKRRASDNESPKDGRYTEDKAGADIVVLSQSQHGERAIELGNEDSLQLARIRTTVRPKESNENAGISNSATPTEIRPIPTRRTPSEIDDMPKSEVFTTKSKDIDPFTPVSSDGQSPGGMSARRIRSGSGSVFDTPATTDLSLRSPIPMAHGLSTERPTMGLRATSTPVLNRKQSSNKTPTSGSISNPNARQYRPVLDPLESKDSKSDPKPQRHDESAVSPYLSSIPLPPLSIPTYLQLELSSTGPSPLYIDRPSSSDIPYESSQVKIERLLNFLLLPPQLEQVLWFGTLACLDAWLYTFTILPLRFARALLILASSWGHNLLQEIRFISNFTYAGLGRIWHRRRAFPSEPSSPIVDARGSRRASDLIHRSSAQGQSFTTQERPTVARGSASHPDSARRRSGLRHRHTESAPSSLTSIDKADILKGLLLLISCSILMYFDPSMMYHSIRGQATIKLYVIYNALEVNWLYFFIPGVLTKNFRSSTAFSPLWVKTFWNVFSLVKHSNAKPTDAARSSARSGFSSSHWRITSCTPLPCFIRLLP